MPDGHGQRGGRGEIPTNERRQEQNEGEPTQEAHG